VDTSQIIFGSDYVWATEPAVPTTIKGIREYKGFNANDISDIMSDNALKLFPRFKK
jgi:predicted TIM-barrel fold metal-dependent hydrolase